MEQRLSLITLGVVDLERAIAFYGELGWEPHSASVPGEVAFYSLGGIAFALWSRDSLAADSRIEDTGGWGGVTLAHNVRTQEEVDAILVRAVDAGARLGRSGAPTPWGGYSGLFVDPDGHPWEIAVNPAWTIDDRGGIDLG